MPRPTFKLFDACKAGELIRFTDGATYWAIVGARGNERLMLLILPADGFPRSENIMGEMDILKRPYESRAVLSYGANYTIDRDEAGACEIGPGGKLVALHGSLIITAKGGDYVCCRAGETTAYFELKAGTVTKELSSERAVFAGWDIALTREKAESPLVVLRVRANSSPPIAAAVVVSTPRAGP